MYKKRKGQFFIIGAILVVMSVYSISNLLNETWEIDSSGLQTDNTIWIIEDIEKNIYKTLETTIDPKNNLNTTLDDFIAREQELLVAQADLDINYTKVYLNNYIEIIIYISKQNKRFEKNITTNIDCLKADPSSEKCNELTAPIDKTVCCKDFNLCC